MSIKHAAVCDQCGAEGQLRGLPDDVPIGWVLLTQVTGEAIRIDGVVHLCSWVCVAAWGDTRALVAIPDIREGEG